ncbi:hypothetical protein Tco_1075345 [Tanacetum coccineum]
MNGSNEEINGIAGEASGISFSSLCVRDDEDGVFLGENRHVARYVYTLLNAPELLYEMFQKHKRLKKYVDYEQFIEVLAMDKSMLEEELRATKSKLKLYDRNQGNVGSQRKYNHSIGDEIVSLESKWYANAEWLCKLQMKASYKCKLQMQNGYASCKLQIVCKCKQAASCKWYANASKLEVQAIASCKWMQPVSKCKLQMVCKCKCKLQMKMQSLSCKCKLQAANVMKMQASCKCKQMQAARCKCKLQMQMQMQMQAANANVLAFASLSTQFVIGTRLLTMRVLGDALAFDLDALAFDPDALAFNPDALAFDLDG